MAFKKAILEMPDDDHNYGKYVEGLRKFYKDPVATYKRSIAKKERLIEKRKRLIEKDETSIRYLNFLIKKHEEK